MKDSKIWETLQNQYRTLQSQYITLQDQTCASISMLQGPTISVTDINIGGIDCGVGGPCPSYLVCTNDGCTPPDTVPITVTFINSGDLDGAISPTVSVGGVDTGIVPNEGASITVPAGGSAIATFAGVTLVHGDNSVCVNWV